MEAVRPKTSRTRYRRFVFGRSASIRRGASRRPSNRQLCVSVSLWFAFRRLLAVAPGLVDGLLVRSHLTQHHCMINAALRHQLLVGAALDDAAVLHQQDEIGAP